MAWCLVRRGISFTFTVCVWCCLSYDCNCHNDVMYVCFVMPNYVTDFD